MHILSLDSLVARRDSIRAEAENVRARLDTLLKELAEIETAEIMVRKFGEEQPSGRSAQPVAPFSRRDELPLAEVPPTSVPDPASLSKRDLILLILSESPIPWMTAAEITAKARALTGKAIKRENISPKLSDMKTDGQIVRDDMKVALVSRVEKNPVAEATGS